MINGLIWGQPAGMKNFVLEHIMIQSSPDHKMSNSLEAWPCMKSWTNPVMIIKCQTALRLDHAWYQEPIQSWTNPVIIIICETTLEAWPCMISWINPVMITFYIIEPWGLTMHDIMNQSSHDQTIYWGLTMHDIMNQSSHDQTIYWGLTMHDVMNQSSHDQTIYDTALGLDHAWWLPIQCPQFLMWTCHPSLPGNTFLKELQEAIVFAWKAILSPLLIACSHDQMSNHCILPMVQSQLIAQHTVHVVPQVLEAGRLPSNYECYKQKSNQRLHRCM